MPAKHLRSDAAVMMPERPPETPLVAYRIDDAQRATFAVLEMIANMPTLGKVPMARLFISVSGAVERGHYILVRLGADPVGYLGYGLCHDDVVKQHFATNHIPDSALCRDGDTVVIFDAFAKNKRAAMFLARMLQKLHPGWDIAVKRAKDEFQFTKRRRLAPPQPGLTPSEMDHYAHLQS